MDALTTGICNVAIGTNALGAATTGCFNIAIGDVAAGGAVTTGSENVAIGRCPLDALTTGYGNDAIGASAAGAVTTGFYNTAIGTKALEKATTACNSIAIGECSLGAAIATGRDNIAIGKEAGKSITSGFVNTAVGKSAGAGTSTGENNGLFGHGAGNNPERSGNFNNHINLGNQSTASFEVTVALTVLSDARDKTDVADLDLGLDYINALRPVYYRWDKRGWYDEWDTPEKIAAGKSDYLAFEPDGSKKRNRWEIGLLAQEVLVAEKKYTSNSQVVNEGIEEAAHEGLTVEGTLGTGYQLQYQKIIMPLIKAVHELSAANIALMKRVKALE